MHTCEYVLLYVDYTSVKLRKNDKSRLQILFITYTVSILIKVTIIFHLAYCNRLNFSLFLPFINLFSAQNSDDSIKTQVTSHSHCNTPLASKFTLSKHQSKPIYNNLLCNLPPFFTASICLPPLLLQPFWPLHCILNTFILKPVYCCSFGFGCFPLASLHGSFSHFKSLIQMSPFLQGLP